MTFTLLSAEEANCVGKGFRPRNPKLSQKLWAHFFFLKVFLHLINAHMAVFVSRRAWILRNALDIS
jgi:hypothetical protein